MRKLLPLLLLLVLSGCLPQSAAPVTYPTIDAAAAAAAGSPVTVYRVEPFGDDETMALYRAEGEEPAIAILRQTRRGWTRERGGAGGPFRHLGSLTYSQSHLGRVETRVGNATRITARSVVVFGEVRCGLRRGPRPRNHLDYADPF